MPRSLNIDIIKGLGICLVVLGHCGCPITHFIYLFHVPIFFIASGYVLSCAYSDNLSGLLTLTRKRLKGLWLPCFFFNTAFLLLTSLFVNLNIQTGGGSISAIAKGVALNAVFLGNGGPMAGACWFLSTLFEITVGYAIVGYVLKRSCVKRREYINLLIGLILFVVSFYLIKHNLRSNVAEHFMGAYVMLCLGAVLRSRHSRLASFNTKRWSVIFIVTLVILLALNRYGSIEVGKGIYTSPWFYIVCALSGWFFMYSISFFMTKVSWLSKTFCYLGKNTVCIIGLHFLAFKIVSLVQISVYGLPQEKLSTFPYLIAEPFWWVAYTVVGICVPLLLNELWNRGKNCISANKKMKEVHV